MIFKTLEGAKIFELENEGLLSELSTIAKSISATSSGLSILIQLIGFTGLRSINICPGQYSSYNNENMKLFIKRLNEMGRAPTILHVLKDYEDQDGLSIFDDGDCVKYMMDKTGLSKLQPRNIFTTFI